MLYNFSDATRIINMLADYYLKQRLVDTKSLQLDFHDTFVIHDGFTIHYSFYNPLTVEIPFSRFLFYPALHMNITISQLTHYFL